MIETGTPAKRPSVSNRCSPYSKRASTKGVGPAFEDARCVEEVKAVISEIEGAFAL